MSEFQINDRILDREAYSLAEEIFKEFRGEHEPDFEPEDFRWDMGDRAHEVADGHSWVIYTYKAIMLCAHCNTDAGEETLYDTGGIAKTDDFGSIASKIAYEELRWRIQDGLDSLIEDYEVPDGYEEEEEDA